MQPTTNESYGSVPRRSLDVEDYIDIIRRHKAWILGPTFGAMVISVVVAFLWPDTFVSSAIIRVVPPQVPEAYVPTNVNMEMSQRINAMAQTILSRGNLTNIINTFNLYQRERQRKPMEDVVEDMKRDINISGVGNIAGNRAISAFTLSFKYDNRIMAQKVTADLVSRFMSENTRDRTTQSVLTTQFLKDQLENAKKDLDAIEDRITKFRTQNYGRLPEQLGNNQILLSSAENRISNLNSAISRVNQEKMLLETELRASKTQLDSIVLPENQAAAQMKSERLQRIEQEITQAENQLASLRERYKETYPDVQSLLAQINRLKRQRDTFQKEDEETFKAAKGKPAPRRVDPNFVRERQNIEANISRIETQIRLKDQQVADYTKEIQGAEKSVKNINTRIESEPVGTQMYQEIIRDRELAKQKYDDLNRKKAMSSIAEEVEKRQQGEALEVLDPASLPQTPTEPKRPNLIAIGTGLGFLMGLGFAVAREAKDASLKNLKDVRAYTNLPVLCSIPLLENTMLVKRKRRLTYLAWAAAVLLGAVAVSGSYYYYYSHTLNPPKG